MSVQIIRGNALDLPVEDSSVDLVVTSPPYFGLRSYQDGGSHYEGQIGSEATPAEFVDALIAATREMVRVLKPSGSIFVNLGDKYANSPPSLTSERVTGLSGGKSFRSSRDRRSREFPGIRQKSLIGIPWRYALRCIDDLGLILRAEVIWSKPNGLPESVTDRVRRSHEQWFHFTKEPRYYSAVDEVREEHAGEFLSSGVRNPRHRYADGKMPSHSAGILGPSSPERKDGGTLVGAARNPLGKLPGSVWTIATEPLRVPDHLGIDHFAAFPTEWPRRIITGWSPRGVCTACGEGRRPVSEALGESARDKMNAQGHNGYTAPPGQQLRALDFKGGHAQSSRPRLLTGYACGCPDTTAPTTPGVVLDPFGGTGTTALVADVLGRDAITVDLSADYCRLAEWRTTDPGQRAKAARVEPPPPVLDGQLSLFGDPA